MVTIVDFLLKSCVSYTGLFQFALFCFMLLSCILFKIKVKKENNGKALLDRVTKVLCCILRIRKYFDTNHKSVTKLGETERKVSEGKLNNYHSQYLSFCNYLFKTNHLRAARFYISPYIAKHGRPFCDGGFYQNEQKTSPRETAACLDEVRLHMNEKGRKYLQCTEPACLVTLIFTDFMLPFNVLNKKPQKCR